jgi:DNA mismatch repair protein MutS
MKITPLRQQYLDIKKQYPGVIVFFRLGDFYETFDEDAKTTSKELGITLTAREMGKGQKIPLAGIPYHAIDNYLSKLINKGHKVAICEQMTPPGNGLVKREVIRIVTPGTVIEPGILKAKNNNFLVSFFIDGEESGLSYVDITTGEFATTQMPADKIQDELERLQPAEILVQENFDLKAILIDKPVTRVEKYYYELDTAVQVLKQHFGVISLEGYGCAHLPLAIRAAGSIIHYIEETQKIVLGYINQLTTYSTSVYMNLDIQTRLNLEVFTGSRWGTNSSSLLDILDRTRTAMGGRLLRKWLGQPLLVLNDLQQRQNRIDWFFKNSEIRNEIINIFGEIADIERLSNRIKSRLANPRDLVALRFSLELLPGIQELINRNKSGDTPDFAIKSYPEITELISTSLVDNPGINFEMGGIIKVGFSSELDNIRSIATNAKGYLANLEQKERERTGIKSLKVGYNRVFGYYIEITNSNLNMVPGDYIRKQTLTNGERFYTPELKEYETSILNAQEKMVELEKSIFYQICDQVSQNSSNIIQSAQVIALIDVYCSLAEIAVRNNYVKPELSDGNAIVIKNGRHPVVEQSIGLETFIPNDTYLCNDDTQLIVLTGPNMSGKSTYLKQVALIVLMAQIGSFVSADQARIGLVDRIFTRIGAQENLAAGQSTFMVEMIETANILNNATADSLIILDEVGRGTSTYDGLSIAWAVIETIHNSPGLKAKTLFATHFHELVDIASFLPKVRNYNVSVDENEGKVVFLHKIVQGGANRSYGIHVARLAGLPNSVLHRAEEILSELETTKMEKRGGAESDTKENVSRQLVFFDENKEIVKEIVKMDINSLSPLEAITKLYELQKKAKSTDKKQ